MGYGMEMVHEDSEESMTVCSIQQWHAPNGNSTVDPFTERFIDVPPSGSVCEIYVRNDVERGVYKAPANQVVRMASDLEVILNKKQLDVLNPLGINCLCFFEERGCRIWGAWTLSSDPLWKYINVRRLLIFIEHSINLGTQWVVFEPNDDNLWAQCDRP